MLGEFVEPSQSYWGKRRGRLSAYSGASPLGRGSLEPGQRVLITYPTGLSGSGAVFGADGWMEQKQHCTLGRLKETIAGHWMRPHWIGMGNEQREPTLPEIWRLTPKKPTRLVVGSLRQCPVKQLNASDTAFLFSSLRKSNYLIASVRTGKHKVRYNNCSNVQFFTQ